MTKYLMIALAVLAILLGLMTKLYLDKRDQFAQEAVKRKAEVAALTTEIRGLEAEKQLLKDRMVFHQEQITVAGEENARITILLEKERARFDKWRSTLASRTLQKPEVTRRAARRDITRRMRKLCKITGGSAGDCKSPAPSGTTLAAPNTARPARSSDRDAGANPAVEPTN